MENKVKELVMHIKQFIPIGRDGCIVPRELLLDCKAELERLSNIDAAFNKIGFDNHQLDMRNEFDSLAKLCEHFNLMQTKIERLEAENAWQPIDTAPKDGTQILCCNENNGEYMVCGYEKGAYLGQGFYFNSEFKIEATHWRPLPQPPEGV